MTNISNFTISENMNARLAEYGLTSAMAEENGWISCDAAAIQTLLGYLPDCEGREISGLQIPFRSPFTSEILTGEDGKPYSGVFLLTPPSSGVRKMAGFHIRTGCNRLCVSVVTYTSAQMPAGHFRLL